MELLEHYWHTKRAYKVHRNPISFYSQFKIMTSAGREVLVVGFNPSNFIDKRKEWNEKNEPFNFGTFSPILSGQFFPHFSSLLLFCVGFLIRNYSERNENKGSGVRCFLKKLISSRWSFKKILEGERKKP